MLKRRNNGEFLDLDGGRIVKSIIVQSINLVAKTTKIAFQKILGPRDGNRGMWKNSMRVKMGSLREIPYLLLKNVSRENSKRVCSKMCQVPWNLEAWK